ncbi:hypothetical protein ANCDUO_03724 [Ancylostoma duodenale]|uniref:RNase H type-1 domain-containing protein n=1 Tax=Ancylostoma duodenale TaxID=51022 RepID=A0A0C2D8C5_9BILA|nr:hypothetical protein ANCDUO_03724 [Ancylostoma duodenale]
MLELRAIFFGLESFGRKWQGIDALIKSDKTSAIAYIKKRGGTRKNAMSMLPRTIWEWALRKEIHLLATHKPGVRNVEAQQGSTVSLRASPESSAKPFHRLT